MTQQIQELIDKIKKEGLETATSTALDIESEAKQNANKIIESAKKEASQIVSDARNQAVKLNESTLKSLQNSSRDMMLSLKSQINDMLKQIVHAEIKESLSSDNLTEIVSKVINSFVEKSQDIENIEVALNSADLSKLKDGILSKLQDKLKGKVAFEPSEEITTGFTISFDSKNSCFDFSETSLVAYLSAYVNNQVKELLEKAVKKDG